MNQCFETQQFGGLANLTMGRTGCIYISLSDSLMPVERIRSRDHNLKYDRLLRKVSNALFVGSTLLQLYMKQLKSDASVILNILLFPPI